MSERLWRGRPLAGWLFASLIVCIWTSWIVIARLSAALTLSVWDITAVRFGVAAVVILPWALRWGLRGLSLPKAAWLALSCGAPYVALAFIGFSYAPAAHGAVLINGTLPLFTLLIGWSIARQRPTPGQSLGVVLILAGCFAIGGDGLLTPVPDQWKGHLFFLGASMLVSGYMIAARAWKITQRHVLVAIPIGSAIFYLPAYFAIDLPSLLKTAPIANWPWDEIALHAILQGLVITLLALPIFTRANELLGSAIMAAFMAAVPGLALLLAIPVLGEIPSLLGFGGVALVTLGVLATIGIIRPQRAAAAGD